jgi:hypothetical protein
VPPWVLCWPTFALLALPWRWSWLILFLLYHCFCHLDHHCLCPLTSSPQSHVTSS